MNANSLTWAIRCVATSAALAALIQPAAIAAKPKRSPVEGQVFTCTPGRPKWVTCDTEFRDPENNMWPMFFYGKPTTSGTYKYSASSPSASFAITCDKMCQPRGDHSRKIIGETVKDGSPPKIAFQAKSMSEFRTKTTEYTDRKGRKKKKSYEYAVVKGVLDIGGRRVDVEAEGTFRYKYDRKATTPNAVYIQLQFTVQGKDLGLEAEGCTGPIDVRMGTTAYLAK